MTRILAEFRAPWSRMLRTTTAFSVSVLLVVVLSGLYTGPRQLLVWQLAMVGVPLLMLVGSLPFMVRGYALTDNGIEVQRLGWKITLPLEGLVSVVGDADALRGSLRLFGNGGLFGITGWFWNRKLGRFRAFATDPSRAVVLQYRNRKIVVTPHDVQHFIVRVRTIVKLRNGG